MSVAEPRWLTSGEETCPTTADAIVKFRWWPAAQMKTLHAHMSPDAILLKAVEEKEDLSFPAPRTLQNQM